jgi:hypothetical protein
VILVSSIPSGVIGVARYLEEDIPIVAWVRQLSTRRSADVARLVDGHRQVALAEVTHLGKGTLAHRWLDGYGHEVARDTFPRSSSATFYFVPALGATFEPPSGQTSGPGTRD